MYDYEGLDTLISADKASSGVNVSMNNSVKVVSPSYTKDDFSSILWDILKKLNIKIAFFLFAVGIFIFSDVFIETILIKFSNSVDGHEATTKGTMIQLFLLTIFYIFFDLFVQTGVM